METTLDRIEGGLREHFDAIDSGRLDYALRDDNREQQLKQWIEQFTLGHVSFDPAGVKARLDENKRFQDVDLRPIGRRARSYNEPEYPAIRFDLPFTGPRAAIKQAIAHSRIHGHYLNSSNAYGNSYGPGQKDGPYSLFFHIPDDRSKEELRAEAKSVVDAVVKMVDKLNGEIDRFNVTLEERMRAKIEQRLAVRNEQDDRMDFLSDFS